jgi:hypothetical protein
VRNLARIAIIFVGLTALTRIPDRLWDVAELLRTPDYGQRGSTAAVILVAAVVVLAALGIGLVALSGRMAAAWFDNDERAALTIEPAELLRIALLTFGYVTIAYSITGGIASIGFTFVNEGAFELGTLPYLAQFAGMIGQFLVGLATIALAGPISHRLAGIRQATKRAVPVSTAPLSSCASCGAPYDPDDYIPGVTHRCSECRQVIE